MKEKCCFNFAFVSSDIYFSRVFLCARSRRIVKSIMFFVCLCFHMSGTINKEKEDSCEMKEVSANTKISSFVLFLFLFNFYSIRIRKKNLSASEIRSRSLANFPIVLIPFEILDFFLFRLILSSFIPFAVLIFSVAYA